MNAPVYVLHCTELTERTQACKSHLAEVGISPTWWRSFHGRTWGLQTSHEFDIGQRLPPGHVGLNAGAWALWQHIYLTKSDPDQPFVIFEDDVEVSWNFRLQLDDLLIQLNYDLPDWDLVFLGLAETEPFVWNKVTERIGGLRSNLCRLDNPFGTHAYVVRHRALPVLLDNMAIAQRNLDQQLWERVLKPGKLVWAACVPSIVKQRTFDYRGTGNPEWKPSTVDTTPIPPSGYSLREQDIKRILGARPETVPYNNDSPEVAAATDALINPFPCIYRGEHRADVYQSLSGKSIPLSECARTRQACHDRRGIEEIASVLSCERCTLRTSMPSRTERTKLPIPDGHFNPSMIVFNDRLILATRDSWGHSKVALWHLTNSSDDWSGEWHADPIASLASDHPDAPRLEDPRLFIFEKQLHSVFSLPDGYPPKRVRVGYCRFSADLSRIEHTHVYESPNNNLYEKNWVPFEYMDGLNWVYASKPNHVVMTEGKTWSTPNPLPWTGGVVRGGATPVLMRCYPRTGSIYPLAEIHPILHPDHGGYGKGYNVYYHFFHGCLKRLEGNVYTMGCIVFEAKPPFRVLRQTATPLIWPDLPGPGESVVKRFVVWPGGAVPHAGHWHIAMGVDDSFSRIIRIPFDKVESALTDTVEGGDAGIVSIRDTPIAMGTSAGGAG